MIGVMLIGNGTWRSSAACHPRGREEEEDVLLLGGSRLATRYRIGIQARPRMGWQLGFASGLRSTGWSSLFFSDSFSFLFLFSILLICNAFPKYLPILGPQVMFTVIHMKISYFT
jgi:hypothetical protein